MAHQQDTTKEAQTQAIEMAVADGPHFNKTTGMWEVWQSNELHSTHFTKLYAGAVYADIAAPIIWNVAGETKTLDRVVEPELPEIPFQGEPFYGSGLYGLEARG